MPIVINMTPFLAINDLHLDRLPSSPVPTSKDRVFRFAVSLLVSHFSRSVRPVQV